MIHTTFSINIFLRSFIALSGLILLISGWLLAGESPIIAAFDLIAGVVIVSLISAGEVSRRWQKRL